MPYAWSFYTLSEPIDVSENHLSLEQILRAPLRIEIPDDSHHDGSTPRRAQLVQDLGDSSNIFVVLDDHRLSIPTVLAFSGDRIALDTVMDWLKSVRGVIVTPVILESNSMLEVADAFTERDQTRDTRLVFDVATEAKNLTKMEMEIDKNSLQNLSNSNENVYSQQLASYIYKETGMRLPRLPLTTISLAGSAKIGRSKVTTIAADIDDSVLEKILRSVQYQV